MCPALRVELREPQGSGTRSWDRDTTGGEPGSPSQVLSPAFSPVKEKQRMGGG